MRHLNATPKTLELPSLPPMYPMEGLMRLNTRLLVVEDEPQSARLVSRVLDINGCRCLVAANAQEARKYLRDEDFSLAVCDVSLPGESGLDLARYILQQNPDAAVVMMSGMDDPKIINLALEIGAYGYVLKPLRPQQLLITIAGALRRRTLDIESRLHQKHLEQTIRSRSVILEQTIGELEREHRILQETHAERDQLLAAIPSILIAADAEGRITQWNHAAAQTFGIEAVSVVDRPFRESGIPWDSGELLAHIADALKEGKTARLREVRFRRPDGREGILGFTVVPFREQGQTRQGFLLSGADITEKQQLELQLRHVQKLESIGQLAAGIAHEINTPTQYLGDNIGFLQDSFIGLKDVLTSCAQLVRQSRAGKVQAELLAKIQAAAQTADLEYLLAEIPKAIHQSTEGIQRVSEIVRSMKEFAHPGTAEKTSVDLNKTIASTITVARNEWKYVAEMVTEFDPSLPLVPCLVGDFNQVILNMIVNATHAIADSTDPGTLEKGRITITTRHNGDWAEIAISDTGAGIPEAIRSKIFDPFFTTKEVGKGTGQGLAISHSVIVEKHGGTITFESEIGKGTTFIIRLPLETSTNEMV